MPRVAQSSVRCPMRSPATPKNGEKSAPSQASAAKTTSCSTDPVVVRTYQPRISASISNAHDVQRSAGHWKRKLRTPNGASADARPVTLPLAVPLAVSVDDVVDRRLLHCPASGIAVVAGQGEAMPIGIVQLHMIASVVIPRPARLLPEQRVLGDGL